MGSGGWRKHGRIEHFPRLDLRLLNRHGLLKQGRAFSWRWDRAGVVAGVLVDDDHLIVKHAGQDGQTGEWCRASSWVTLTTTPCFFGGSRAWLVCPGCGRHCVTLYLLLLGNEWRCRVCTDLRYACQSESRADRARRKAGRLRRQLGGGDDLSLPVPDKPTGMHWSTYERLRARESATYSLSRDLAGLIHRLERRR